MVNQHGPLTQQTYEAAKEHATRSKGTATKDPKAYRPRPQELHHSASRTHIGALALLVDPSRAVAQDPIWTVPASGYQKWEDFLADAYVRHAVETTSHKPGALLCQGL